MDFPNPAPRTVARVLVPAAMLFLFLGMAISAHIYYSTHPFNPGAVVLSDFENREDNPRGYAPAAIGTAIACSLLFPAAPLFLRTMRGSWWGASGAWIYGAACVSGIFMAALEPVPADLYGLHIALAFMTFLGMIGGLGCVSVAAARTRLRPGRRVWAAAAFVDAVAILLALDVIPLPKRGSIGLWNSLAAGELALVALIAAGTAGFATACDLKYSNGR